MAECSKCKSKIEEGSKFCSKCGEPVSDISISLSKTSEHAEVNVGYAEAEAGDPVLDVDVDHTEGDTKSEIDYVEVDMTDMHLPEDIEVNLKEEPSVSEGLPPKNESSNQSSVNNGNLPPKAESSNQSYPSNEGLPPKNDASSSSNQSSVSSGDLPPQTESVGFSSQSSANAGTNSQNQSGYNNQEQYSSNNQGQNNFNQNFQNFANTPNRTASFNRNDIEQNKIVSIFSYLGILVIIPLLVAPNSPFARFHANQGLILFIASLILGSVSSATFFVPFIGGIISTAISILILVLCILGIINAASGEAKELPVIGKLKILH